MQQPNDRLTLNELDRQTDCGADGMREMDVATETATDDSGPFACRD